MEAVEEGGEADGVECFDCLSVKGELGLGLGVFWCLGWVEKWMGWGEGSLGRVDM